MASLKRRNHFKKDKLAKLSEDLSKMQTQKEKIVELRDDDRIRKRDESSGAGESSQRKELIGDGY